MKRLRKFFRRPRAEQRLFVTAFFLLVVARLGLWLRGYPATARRLQRFERPGRRPGPAVAAEQIRWAVATAADYVPRSTCLVQAMAGSVLCRRAGIAADVRIGVGRDPERGFEAHAWLESNDRILLGEEEIERFTALTTLGGKPL
jgi:hypothetical protein